MWNRKICKWEFACSCWSSLIQSEWLWYAGCVWKCLRNMSSKLIVVLCELDYWFCAESHTVNSTLHITTYERLQPGWGYEESTKTPSTELLSSLLLSDDLMHSAHSIALWACYLKKGARRTWMKVSRRVIYFIFFTICYRLTAVSSSFQKSPV